MDQFTWTEKYRAWRKANRHKIHSRRRKHLSNSHLHISSDSSMFIYHGQGLGYPPKAFIDSDSDQESPTHIPILKDYCRTCLTEKVRCSCQATSNWSGKLIDTIQPAPPNTDSNQDREDVQDNPLLSNWTDQDDFWSDKTYDQARPLLILKPAPPIPLPKEMRIVSAASTCIHITTELKLPCRAYPPNFFQDGLKALELTPLPKQHAHHLNQKTLTTLPCAQLKPQSDPRKHFPF